MTKSKKTASTAKISSSNFNFDFQKLEQQLEDVFTRNFPKLPDSAVNLIVKFAPYVVVLGIIMSLSTLFSFLGFGRMASIYRMVGLRASFSYQLYQIVFILQTVVMAYATPGLFAKKASAWKLMYYLSWVQLATNLLSGNLINLLISGLISFYILFQIKGSYKK